MYQQVCVDPVVDPGAEIPDYDSRDPYRGSYGPGGGQRPPRPPPRQQPPPPRPQPRDPNAPRISVSGECMNCSMTSSDRENFSAHSSQSMRNVHILLQYVL